jgi:hypothetical protein
MDTYTLPLALFDFVPNIAYLVGAYFLVRLILRERGTRCGRMFMAGALFVFLGGALKAAWKLLYVVTGQDLTLLGEQQFVLLAIGFTGTVTAIILLAREWGRTAPPGRGRRDRAGGAGGAGPAVLPAMAAWKIPFLLVMTLAQLGALGILAYLGFRRKLPLAGALFAVTFTATLAMAILASSPQTISMQWIEEGVNSFGQIAFAVGAYVLYSRGTGC